MAEPLDRDEALRRLARGLDLPEEILGSPSPDGSWSDATAVFAEELEELRERYEAQRAGAADGLADLPLSACRYDPGTPLEHDWTQGWIFAQEQRRDALGTLDHPPEFYAELARREGRGPEALEADPVVRILGGYAPLPAAEPLSVRFGGRSVPVADPDDPALEMEASWDRLVVALATCTGRSRPNTQRRVAAPRAVTHVAPLSASGGCGGCPATSRRGTTSSIVRRAIRGDPCRGLDHTSWVAHLLTMLTSSPTTLSGRIPLDDLALFDDL